MNKYTFLFRAVPAIVVSLALAGCSTIMTGARREVNLRSTPSGARVAITDEKGVRIFEGTTPTVVTLKTGKAYFAPKRYKVEISKDGSQPTTVVLRSTVSAWYAGNVIFGGLLGLLVIDPLTGAMYTLPKEKAVSLVPVSAAMESHSPEPGLRILGIQDLSDELTPHLVRLN